MMYRSILLLLTITIFISGCGVRKNDRVVSTSSSDTTVEQTNAETSTEDNVTSDDISTSPSETEPELTTETDTTSVSTTTDAETTDAENVTTEEFTPDVPKTSISDAITSITASNAFVYNSTDGILLGMKGDGENIVPASITKLLTALYALKVAPKDLVITPTSDVLSLVGKNSSLAYIKTNHKLTVSQLIQGMMMPSGNDAAYVLAAGVGRYLADDGSLPGKEAVDLFMASVNEYAKSIGCTDTHFTVPDGLARENHYTSSHDMIIIGKLATEDPLISKFAKTVSQKVYYASGHNITWTNTNSLINPNSKYYSPYVNGLKTGSLSGNYCLYVSALINEKTYLIGIFGCPEKNGRYDDAHILIDAILDSVKEAGN